MCRETISIQIPIPYLEDDQHGRLDVPQDEGLAAVLLPRIPPSGYDPPSGCISKAVIDEGLVVQPDCSLEVKHVLQHLESSAEDEGNRDKLMG